MPVMTALVNSYYEASVSRPPQKPTLQGAVRADVCVIGGGFTGLSCALELARRGQKVVVLESERVGWGASGRNGGQMIYGYSTDDLRAAAKQADVSEKYLFDMSTEAVSLVRQRVSEFNIDCDLRMGYFLAAIHRRHCHWLDERMRKLSEDYNYHVRVLDATETRERIASRRYCGALEDDNSGHLHPLKYLLGLLQAAESAGAEIYEQTSALSAEETADGAKIKTAEGEVSCRAMVFAGNAYLDIAPPRLRSRIMPVSTYIAATSPLGEREAENLISGHSVCDMNFILDYFRCSADSRMLFGGRVSYANREPADIAHTIRQRMIRVFPQLSEAQIEYAWGGSIAITINRFPDIGRHGRAAYYAQGFSGHGLAMSGFAGKVIADAVAGDSEKFDVFARVRHADFVGGRYLRTPLLVLAMMYYRLRDILG